MSKIYISLAKAQKVKAIEEALIYVGEMVTDREDGDTYIGVYEALESELLSLKARDDTKARIRQRLSQRSMSLAA
jgi:hypothetical protein